MESHDVAIGQLELALNKAPAGPPVAAVTVTVAAPQAGPPAPEPFEAIKRQWMWGGGRDDPNLPPTPYDFDQNTEIELAYRQYKSKGEPAILPGINSDVRGVPGAGRALAGNAHATYEVDFERMLQINESTRYERKLTWRQLQPGEQPWGCGR